MAGRTQELRARPIFLQKIIYRTQFSCDNTLMSELKAPAYAKASAGKQSSKFKAKYIIGIDEVGRGPLAGPVVVAALCAPQKFQFPNSKLQITSNSKTQSIKLPLRDSKRLSQKQREMWFTYLKNHPHIFYTTATVSPRVVDKINISQAANRAASLAALKVLATRGLAASGIRIFLDGGLHLNSKTLVASGYSLVVRTIIKGDEKVPAIAAASIIAKVTRDRIMHRLHKKYPAYGFNTHKGYGTKQHRKAMHKNGLSPIHRRSFRVKTL